MPFLRAAAAIGIALLPSALKIPIYRHLFGYRIGKRTTIGCSPLIGVGACEIADDVRIGHFNLFLSVKRLGIGEHARIGFLNLFRGGNVIQIGAYAAILRQNVMNSIVNPEAANPAAPELILGDGVTVTTGHWFDFTDRIRVGPHTIIGGRNSSFWTHNRDRTRPISVGHHCYLGSEIRMAPGIRVAPCSVVALGSVLLRSIDESGCLIAGNPAAIARPLADRDRTLITRKTRTDIPDDLAARLLPTEFTGGPQAGPDTSSTELAATYRASCPGAE